MKHTMNTFLFLALLGVPVLRVTTLQGAPPVNNWTTFNSYIAPSAAPSLLTLSINNSLPGTKIVFTNGACLFMSTPPLFYKATDGAGVFWSGNSSTTHSVDVETGSILAGAANTGTTNVSHTVILGSVSGFLSDVSNVTNYVSDGGVTGVVIDGKNANLITSDGAATFVDVLPNHTNFFSTVYSGSLGASRTQGSNERLIAQYGSAAFGNDLDAANFTWLFGSHFTNRTGGFTVGYNGVPVLFANATGVGMGTNAPSQKLEVSGNIKASDGFVFMIGTNTLSISGTNIIVNGVTR